MAPTLEDALQQVEQSGVYPAPLFRLMVQRELRLARRFAYPFTLLEVALEGNTMETEQALGVLVGNLRRHVDLVGSADGGRWLVLSPRAAQPTSLIMAERLKLLAESKLLAGTGRVSLGGVEVGPGDDNLDLTELLELLARTVSLVKGHSGSRAVIYSVRDLREEV